MPASQVSSSGRSRAQAAKYLRNLLGDVERRNSRQLGDALPERMQRQLNHAAVSVRAWT